MSLEDTQAGSSGRQGVVLELNRLFLLQNQADVRSW